MRKDRSHSPELHSRCPTFLLGQHSLGRWVVQDQQHLCGDVFINRSDALKFAMFENGNEPRGVVMVPGILELDTKVETLEGGKASENRLSQPRRA